MICSIHQPQSFPWLGYFAKIMTSDTFIFLDNVQYKKNEYQNRNRIKYDDKAHWLTIPVKYRFGQYINEVEINNTVNWRRKVINSLQTYYAKSPYFNQFFPIIKELINKDYTSLNIFNIDFTLWVLNFMEINTQTLISSQIISTDTFRELPRSEKLMMLVHKTEASTYLSGQGGKEYLDEDIFKKNNINIHYQKYIHPKYTQNGEEFVSHLSILDLLFNEGKNSKSIILEGMK